MTTQTTLERQPAAGEVLKLLPRFVIAFAFIGAMLFVPARTLNWPMAWAMIGVFLVYMVALTALLLRYNPGLIAERSRVMTHDTKGFDKVITAVMTPVYFGTWVLAGLDYRNGWSPPFPLAVQLAGLVVVVLGFALLGWAMVSNAYFSRVVRIQEDRGQRVVTGGPYRFVRHPGYAGFIVAWPATVIALGSLWALIPAAVTALSLVIRTALEDRTLQAELDGYKAYTQQTRYRLLPGIW
jgi:protein-S-isoprenylcysteine O-methyltransferase Ste14